MQLSGHNVGFSNGRMYLGEDGKYPSCRLPLSPMSLVGWDFGGVNQCMYWQPKLRTVVGCLVDTSTKVAVNPSSTGLRGCDTHLDYFPHTKLVPGEVEHRILPFFAIIRFMMFTRGFPQLGPFHSLCT